MCEMAHCSESILQAITGSTNSSPEPEPGRSGKRLCRRTTSSFVNDLLRPHVGAISTYSAPADAHVCEDVCLSYVMSSACFRYGFGLLDAGLMVQQAARFNAVAPQRKCMQEVTLRPSR